MDYKEPFRVLITCEILGILKGIERKELVTYSTLLVYYLIGIPLVIYFAYPFGLGEKVYGIWLAFTIVNIVLAVLYFISIYNLDMYGQYSLPTGK